MNQPGVAGRDQLTLVVPHLPPESRSTSSSGRRSMGLEQDLVSVAIRPRVHEGPMKTDRATVPARRLMTRGGRPVTRSTARTVSPLIPPVQNRVESDVGLLGRPGPVARDRVEEDVGSCSRIHRRGTPEQRLLSDRHHLHRVEATIAFVPDVPGRSRGRLHPVQPSADRRRWEHSEKAHRARHHRPQLGHREVQRPGGRTGPQIHGADTTSTTTSTGFLNDVEEDCQLKISKD